MPRILSLSRCASFPDKSSIASTTLLDFLLPTCRPITHAQESPQRRHARRLSLASRRLQCSHVTLERAFFDGLARAATCSQHQSIHPFQRRPSTRRAALSSSAVTCAPQNYDGWDYEDYAEVVPREELEAKQNLQGQPDPGGTDQEDASLQGFFDANLAYKFAASSKLPPNFFMDVRDLPKKVDIEMKQLEEDEAQKAAHRAPTIKKRGETAGHDVGAQVKLLQSVRELEAKLAKARSDLNKSMTRRVPLQPSVDGEDPMTLTKEDYKGLVDLYYYSHKRRFGPDAPDSSPTPVLLEDYAFALSEDFAPANDPSTGTYIDEQDYRSPLDDIAEALRSNQLREIAVMQRFVDLLLQDDSSLGALHEAYKKLPTPGVAYLPTGVIRLFLQRMSTPWMRSEKAMIRYLSLIDDMQKANLPINRSEWSSAIYLAGRAFTKVTAEDMKNAFAIWQRMENEAGVQASHVTFNILFDIAVRAGKFPIAQSMLKEMHQRGLRLNRLGRVSLIYFHGLRGDGDAVRKAYRDFVDASEIVDTLVLNCVIASLMNANEPTAAEQTYERMKDLQRRFQLKQRPDGSETLYLRYGHGGHDSLLDRDMASNSLGRVLDKAPRLSDNLPENHAELQSIMPLTPDQYTFRAMLAYHANKSGNLDRLTVLMNDMIGTFNLPLQSIHFQLLFKGFALHGVMDDKNCTWNLKKLDMTWDACRKAIKEAQSSRRASKTASEQLALPSLLTAADVEAQSFPSKAAGDGKPPLPQRKRLSRWNDFVLDLALFPQQRRKDIERVHSQLFDEDKGTETSKLFHNPFFPQQQQSPPPRSSSRSSNSTQDTYYPLGLGHTGLDHEEGEYTLPSPMKSIAAEDPSNQAWYFNSDVHSDVHSDGDSSSSTAAHETSTATLNPNPNNQPSSADHSNPDERPPSQFLQGIRPSRPLISWLLRAYTRLTGSRAKVEEIYNASRKVWRPADENEREGLYVVLRRCLKDCDRFRGWGP